MPHSESIRKAAILLLSLDRPVAAEVISVMPRNLVEPVTMEIAKIKNIARDEQEGVFDEFLKLIDDRVPIEVGGMDFANELLEQSLGTDGADEILENIRQSMNSVPFGFLQKLEAENLLTFIIDEHPQTIALIMSHLPTSLGAEVLSGLSPEKQLDVVRRVANMEQTSPEVIGDVEHSLERRMTTMFNQHFEKAGGVPMVAQILNVTDRMTNKGILESLEEDEAELVDEIRRLMFVFEDILKLDDKSIQALMKEVESSQWALALKGASEDIKQRILGCLSERAADLLREEMDYLGPVRLSDVESMQQQIVDTVRRLEDSGAIQVGSGGEAEQFVN